MRKLGSFLLGGVIGAGVALLFAPRAGAETRAMIADKADEYWGKGQTWCDQSRTYIKESFVGVQPSIYKKSEELRQKIDNARTLIAEQVAKNASAARDAISEKVPAAAGRINQAADVLRGHIDTAAEKLKEKATSTAGSANAQVAAKEVVITSVDATVASPVLEMPPLKPLDS